MQPTARILVFELFRKGDCFAIPFKKPALIANFAYHAQSQKIMDRQVESPKRNKYLIVGLGNFDMPQTRHSVGMQVVDKLANCLHTCFHREKECAGCVATASLNGLDLVLLKPKMPMNVNGTSVRKTVSSYNIRPENVYLLHDDIEKGLGQLSVKEMGSANGHNGVRSVIDSLRSDAMPRIKIGIDRPASRGQVAEYVLSNFPREEQEIIDRAVNQSIEKIADHLAKRTGEDMRRLLQLEIDDLKDKEKTR